MIDIYSAGREGALSAVVDFYAVTMANAWVEEGTADQRACFQLYFRQNPFAGGYAIVAGLDPAIEWLQSFCCSDDLIDFLRSVPGRDGKAILTEKTLRYLKGRRLTLDVDAVPEGTVAFPFLPIVRVEGSVVECQLVEAALLNTINFQTLIATKSARVCDAARGDTVVEFGLRRAQGFDGALSASRAAFIGGCRGTSNLWAGKIFNIPLVGTHAHSWVMTHSSEQLAFENYARHMPNNCVFLIDTIDTLDGAERAAEVGTQLRERGYELAGVRLDSGDLAKLSLSVRRILDEAGFPNAQIVATNDLDEKLIQNLKLVQKSAISVWGVGTNLVTGGDQCALGGVYKIAGIQRTPGTWEYPVKRAENPTKSSFPGRLNATRCYDKTGRMVGDQIYDEENPEQSNLLVGPTNPAEMVKLRGEITHRESLLVPVFRQGQLLYDRPSLSEIQKRCLQQISCLAPETRRFDNPDKYPCGLAPKLSDRRQQILRAALLAE